MSLEKNLYLDDTLSVTLPEKRIGLGIFSSPHSGSEYPPELLARTHLSTQLLRSSEDAFIDQVFAGAPRHGAPLLASRIPRAWLDLNRAEDELDPALIAGAPKAPRSPRINAGLGVIPRVVSDSRSIHPGKITLASAKERISRYHKPYHTMLGELMAETREACGKAILFDCHSMPHDALAGSTMVNGARPEVVLGDRFGASCDRWIVDAAMDFFSAAGFRVTRNAPFAGGYITQTYGRPSQGLHALQIELDRSLYMNEITIQKKDGFERFCRRIDVVVRQLAELGNERVRIAAE